MSERCISLLAVVVLSLLAVTPAAAQFLYPQMPQLPNCSTCPTLGDVASIRKPVVQEEVKPVTAAAKVTVAAVANARMPATIRARKVDSMSADQWKLLRLTARLSEIDTELVWYQYKVGADSFDNLLISLAAIAAGKAPPELSASMEQFRWKIVPLLLERKDIDRQIFRIEYPSGKLMPGTYVDPARSGPSDGSYQVYRSDESTPGAVVGPAPPPCHQEERSHREYRMMLEPNGFDGDGTPMYRNVYQPFPVSELVTICP